MVGERASSRVGRVSRLVLPGVGMIAVTFGFARYGYGLLLPWMQGELGMDSRAGGLIASGSYVSYLVGNGVVPWLTVRFGPRLPVALGAASAAAGMVLIAAAGGDVGVGVGVLVAGVAAGLAFPPYADVVVWNVPAAYRAVSWSAISSGTGWGVAVAGSVAVVLGARWRLVWLVFAAVTVVVGAVAWACAPAKRDGRAGPDGPSRPVPRMHLAWFVCPRSGPLLVSAALVGAGSSVWWVFGVDAMRAGGGADTPARLAYAACGVAGVLASATGLLTRRIGLRLAYRGLGAALVASLVLWGLPWLGVVGAFAVAALFGFAYNAAIAVQGLWSAEVFATRPSAGVAAVNTTLTAGTITGPMAAGMGIHAFGYPPTLFAAGAVVAGALLYAPPPSRPEAGV